MGIRAKYYIKTGVMFVLFVVTFLALGELGLGKILGPGGYFIGVSFLPSFVTAYALWPKVWSPVELPKKLIRWHQVFAAMIYGAVLLTQIAIASAINSKSQSSLEHGIQRSLARI